MWLLFNIFQECHVPRMSDDIIHTLTGPVTKPTGPKPRRSVHSERDFDGRWSETMPRKNVSYGSVKNESLEKLEEDAETISNPNSPIKREETRRFHLNTSSSSPYSDVRKDLNLLIESYKSESHYGDILNSSDSSSPNKSPKKPTNVNKSNEYRRPTQPSKQNQSGWNMWTWVVVLSVLVVMIGIIRYYSTDSEQQSNRMMNVTRKKVADLAKLFPSQEKWIWSSFTSGINDVALNLTKPAIIVLLANDEKTTNCLETKVAGIVSSTLGGGNFEKLTTETMGNNQTEVLSVVEKCLERTKTMVFSDILNMQPEAVKALHWILDSYHSLHGEAVYMITMKYELPDEIKKPTSYVELLLRKRFSSVMEKEILDPLIVRITTGAVLPIKAEKTIPC